MLADLGRWHEDEAVYNREAIGPVPSYESDEAGVEGTDTIGDAEQRLRRGMSYRPKSSTNEQVLMSWTHFRTFYATKIHQPLLEVSRLLLNVLGVITDMLGARVVLARN